MLLPHLQLSAFKARRAALRSHHASPNPKAAAQVHHPPAPSQDTANVTGQGDAAPVYDQQVNRCLNAGHGGQVSQLQPLPPGAQDATQRKSSC